MSTSTAAKRTLVLKMSVSLNGFVGGPNGELAQTKPDRVAQGLHTPADTRLVSAIPFSSGVVATIYRPA
ncbi:hypothetical protein [Paraburkholderia sp. J12]|uniref:hypothetical protein n=1 Tax=Paraburkholderia sp. J12 TaxID=2805432 RepID=UPI002ABE37BF|nr:hypothetical protein [Paraburkholderia sp. J12]